MSNPLHKGFLSYLAPALNFSGLPFFFQSGFAGWGHILMFHRILPEKNGLRIHNHQSLELTPEHFEDVIRFFHDRSYDFITLDELSFRLQHQHSNNKFVVLTFDDGYKDNYEYAYPIAKKYGVPLTIYIATDFPEQKMILWWYLLEDLILQRTNVEIDWNGEKHVFSCKTEIEKEQVFNAIRRLFNSTYYYDTFHHSLVQLFERLGLDPYTYTSQVSMSWDEIRELSTDPLISIGAHTVRHPPLSMLSQENLEEELSGSRRLIQDRIGKPINHFAYPFGKKTEASVREFACAKELGYLTAVTTRMANIFPEHKNHLHSLPRINVNRVTDKHVLSMQTKGMLPFMVHKGKRIVTD